MWESKRAVAAAAAKSLQSCPALCDPIDGSPPGSPVPGILQARTLEWVAISFSNAWKWKVKVKLPSHIRLWLFMTPWTAAYQAPPSMGFSRQEYWSGLPLPSPMQKRHRCKNSVLDSAGEGKVGWFERIALKHVYYHMWNRSPVQVWCMRQGAQGWCTGMTLRGGMAREVGGGFRMRSTYTPMADSRQCMAKTTIIL